MHASIPFVVTRARARTNASEEAARDAAWDWDDGNGGDVSCDGGDDGNGEDDDELDDELDDDGSPGTNASRST